MKINISVWNNEETVYYPLDKQLSPLDFVDAYRIGFVVIVDGEVVSHHNTLDEAQSFVDEANLTMGREQLINYLKTTDDSVKLRRIAVFESSKAYFGEDKRNINVHGSCVYYPLNGLEGCVVGRLLPPEYIAEIENVPVEELDELPEYLEAVEYDFLQKLQEWHDNPGHRSKMEATIRKEYL